MDAAMVTAIGALLAALLAAAATVYGARVAGRASREGNAVTGFNNLTDQLQEERADLRTQVAALTTALAAEQAESKRLRELVLTLGGQP